MRANTCPGGSRRPAAAMALAGWMALAAPMAGWAVPPAPPSAPPTSPSPTPHAAPRAGGDAFVPEGDIGKVQKSIETLRAWRIAEELGFDEKTNARLFTFLRESDEKRIRIEADNRDLLRTLRERLRETAPDAARVAPLLDRLAENQRRQKALEEEHLRKVRETLDPVQAARYILFELHFQRELRDRVVLTVRDRRGRQGASEGAVPACEKGPAGAGR
jgi:hypothetical protein